MSGFPTIADVVAWLMDRDQPAMARAVELLDENYGRCRSANERTLREYYALKAQHEPPQYRHPNYRSPPESDG